MQNALLEVRSSTCQSRSASEYTVYKGNHNRCEFIYKIAGYTFSWILFRKHGCKCSTKYTFNIGLYEDFGEKRHETKYTWIYIFVFLPWNVVHTHNWFHSIDFSFVMCQIQFSNMLYTALNITRTVFVKCFQLHFFTIPNNLQFTDSEWPTVLDTIVLYYLSCITKNKISVLRKNIFETPTTNKIIGFIYFNF